ncbi:MAG: phosphonate ABC transporter, permease protein PhnE [Armatimonadota bacterium]
MTPEFARRPPFPWRAWLAAVGVVAVLGWSAAGTRFDPGRLAAGIPEILIFFRGMLPPWPAGFAHRLWEPLLETLRIAIASSLGGALLALPFCLVGARNLAPTPWVHALGRGVLNLLRTVPDLVLAALLAAAFGIGPAAGFLALLLFSFGVVAKLLADTVETIDPGPMEAVAAAGGTRLAQAVLAVLPQVAPDFVAYTLYAFEINVRAAAVLGLVGAGGIGVLLKTQIAFLNYGNVGIIVAATFVVVFLIDTLSGALRRRLA